MAYTNGTAANYKDLLSAMVTFASANGWTVLEQSETKVYLKGIGLAGLDEIYVGVETFENPTSGIYNWNLYGSWGYKAGREFSKMPRSSFISTGDLPVLCLWNTSMDYWMVANPRRIIVCAKVGTTYQMCHLGHITPLATDAQYPYPLFLGGTAYNNTTSYASSYLGSFWSTYGLSYQGGRLHTPGGAWARQYPFGNTDSELKPLFNAQNICSSIEGTILNGLDGSYLLEPVYLVSKNPAIYGHVEGLFRVSGYNNTSENIITVDGVNYIVFQDTFRSGFGDYCAMRMN